MTAASLSVSRNKDRAVMAERVTALARSLGAETEIQSWEQPRPREIWINIRAARGLCLTIDLDGDSRQQRQGTWVLSWHMATDSDARLNPSFGEVNPYHFQKATHIAYDFAGLLATLESGLTAARDGRAFKAETGES